MCRKVYFFVVCGFALVRELWPQAGTGAQADRQAVCGLSELVGLARVGKVLSRDTRCLF